MIDPRLPELFVRLWNKNLAEYEERVTVDNINNGWCYHMAIILQRIYGGEIVSNTDRIDHACIKIGDLCYDTDYPLGCKKLAEAFDRHGNEFRDFKSYCQEWSAIGGSGPICMTFIEQVISSYKRLCES
jgi:hypothetical protein